MAGTIFLFAGLATCAIAAIRRRSGNRILIWLGIWCALYGARPLAKSLAALSVLPHWFLPFLPFLDVAGAYLVVVVASFCFLQLSQGKLRILIQLEIVVGLAIALAAFASLLWNGTPYKFIFYNQLLATFFLLVLLVVVTVPGLSRKYLVIPDRGALAVGVLLFAFEALYVNLARPFGHTTPEIFDVLGFAVLLLSFGYVALQFVSANERRLLSIENELAIAREIQRSILPGSSPERQDLRISAAYRPMTAVAGDFYEFIPLDQHRIGFLVADVSGHGVPAALIAAMLKVALQTVLPHAGNPGEVLCQLNRILSAQLHDQFVTAAYLLIDTQNRKALYSAAGHPPLLHSHGSQLERIESNGIVFGVLPDPGYPVRDMPIHPGDRFLLYTDGAIEPENAAGESFGDHQLEQVIRRNQSRPSSDLIEQLLSEIRHWQPASLAQQDDITLIVIDVL
jgi:phosphoserine phosphatase RsbU/P